MKRKKKAKKKMERKRNKYLIKPRRVKQGKIIKINRKTNHKPTHHHHHHHHHQPHTLSRLESTQPRTRSVNFPQFSTPDYFALNFPNHLPF